MIRRVEAGFAQVVAIADSLAQRRLGKPNAFNSS